jgi:hypothetical protein
MVNRRFLQVLNSIQTKGVSMKISRSILILGFAVFILTTANSQASTRRQDLMGTPITFNANVPGVTLSINSVEYRGSLPQTINFQPGTYALVARAAGYKDFTTTFTVVQGRAMTVSIVMEPDRPAMVDVTFTSNAPNTILTFANQRLSRPLPQTITTAPGTYTIRAEAAGFEPLSTTVTVTGSVTIPLNLVPARVSVQLVSEIRGIQVTVNGQRLRGNFPQTVQLPLGQAQIIASAPGFQDQILNVDITGPQTISLVLQPLLATLRVIGSVQVFIDGALQQGETISVEPGQRSVRIVSGSLSSEQRINFVAGRSYELVPSLGFSVR